MSAEEVLRRAANDGTIDSAKWSHAFVEILARLEENIYRHFPIPIDLGDQPPYRPRTPSTPPEPGAENNELPGAQSLTAERISLASTSPQAKSYLSELGSEAPSYRERLSSTAPTTKQAATLPPELLSSYAHLKRNFTTSFASSPPHTVQRLAELLLDPNTHHRTLNSYLNALTRVLSVSSPLSLFPLPVSETPAPGASRVLIHGATPATLTEGQRKEEREGLGGALLSPVPWLVQISEEEDRVMAEDVLNKRVNITTNAGVSSSDTIKSQGVERESIVESQSNVSNVMNGSTGLAQDLNQHVDASQPNDAEPERSPQTSDHPVARGPEAIGMEDTGPQGSGGIDSDGIGHKIDIFAAVGRSSSSDKTQEVVDRDGDVAMDTSFESKLDAK